jgi:hypothetical protein
LYSEEIEVSYFAAGICAHLTSDTELKWDGVDSTKENFIDELVRIEFFFESD